MSSAWIKTHLTTVTLLPQIGRTRRAKYKTNPSRFPEKSTDPCGSPVPKELVDRPSLECAVKRSRTHLQIRPVPPTQASHNAPTALAWQYVSVLHPGRLLTGQYWEGARQEKERKTNMQPGPMHPPRGRCCVLQGLTMRRTSRPFQTCYPVLVSRDNNAQPERRKSTHASAKAPTPPRFCPPAGPTPSPRSRVIRKTSTGRLRTKKFSP